MNEMLKPHPLAAKIAKFAEEFDISNSTASRYLAGSSRLYDQLAVGGTCGQRVENRVKEKMREMRKERRKQNKQK